MCRHFIRFNNSNIYFNMITNFENITTELTMKELVLLPFIVKGFKHHRDKPIKAPEIIEKLNTWLEANNYEQRLTPARLRKFVNHIRTTGTLPLIATPKGYFVSYDKKEIEKQIKSLKERARSIERCANGLNKYLN